LQVLDESQDESPKDEKTVNLSIADGMLTIMEMVLFFSVTHHSFADGNKVVAQTPEGTRVATPTPLRDNSASGLNGPAKSSYASALKAKPTDWHLEFSIEGHPIPLETTIYGAIHQHEARKSCKPSFYLSQIWSSVYTIKFKKVPGPAPLPESEHVLARANPQLGQRF
jgi:E3 ubiquitin-protein ligase TRIP12